MKKIILSAASLAVAAVASVSVVPTTSEAIPAFARQTGAACLACHFQSFPTLNAYGRTFKMSALTDVGDQALVEDDHMSLPESLNWTVMVRPQFNTSDDGLGNVGSVTKEFVFADQVFMIGGRAGEHTGTFIEYDGAYANVQMFNSWDMGDMKVGVTVWQDGFGEDSGLQLMNVWGQHGGMLGGKSLSINNSMGATDAHGVTGWAASDEWAAQLALVNVVTPAAGGAGSADQTLSPTIRGNYFLGAGDWEIGLGLIAVTGSAGEGLAKQDTKRTGFDVQALGEVGDMQIGVFADYATAPAGSATATNFYNASLVDSRTGYSVRVSVKPTHNIILLAGLGQDKTGAAIEDKALAGVEWEAYQNFAVQLVYGTSKIGGVTAKTTSFDFELLI